MNIKGLGLSDVGVIRSHNEDYFLVDDELGFYIVCDGVGGGRGGEVASKLAAEKCAEYLRLNRQVIEEYYCLGNNDSIILNLMQSAILESCKYVHRQGMKDPNLNGMSTPLTAL